MGPVSFFGSPTAACLCPDSDRRPASSAAHSPRAAASSPVPRSATSHRTWPPGIDGVLGYSVLASNVFHGAACLHLLQGCDDLRFHMLAWRHISPPAFRRKSYLLLDGFRGSYMDPSRMQELSSTAAVERRRVHISGLVFEEREAPRGPDGICSSSPNQVNGLDCGPAPLRF
jgi:hypothetical protein